MQKRGILLFSLVILLFFINSCGLGQDELIVPSNDLLGDIGRDIKILSIEDNQDNTYSITVENLKDKTYLGFLVNALGEGKRGQSTILSSLGPFEIKIYKIGFPEDISNVCEFSIYSNPT